MKAIAVILLSLALSNVLAGCAHVPADTVSVSRPSVRLNPQQRAAENWLNPAQCLGAAADCGIH